MAKPKVSMSYGLHVSDGFNDPAYDMMLLSNAGPHGVDSEQVSQMDETELDAYLRAAEESGTVVFEKPIEALNPNEKRCLAYLIADGYTDITTLIEDGAALANIDLLVNGDLWEMKNASTSGSVRTQIQRSRRKWFLLGLGQDARTFLTTEGYQGDYASVLKIADEALKEGERIIIYSRRGRAVIDIAK